LLSNFVVQSIVENRMCDDSPSIADEINQIGQGRDLQETAPKPPARDVLTPVRKDRIKTKNNKNNTTPRSNNTPRQRGPMDSFLSGAVSALRRKLSPEKEADTEDGDLKRSRSEHLNK